MQTLTDPSHSTIEATGASGQRRPIPITHYLPTKDAGSTARIE